jgi:hypothetical protein
MPLILEGGAWKINALSPDPLSLVALAIGLLALSQLPA